MARIQTHSGHAASPWLVAGILCYLILALVLSVIFVSRAWPGNPFYRPIYAAEERRVAGLQVTVESVQKIDQALALMSRLPDSRVVPAFSQDDVERILSRVAFARAVIQRAQEIDPNSREKAAIDHCVEAILGPVKSLPAFPSSNPRWWPAATLRDTVDLLQCAHAVLELRASCLRDSPSPAYWWFHIWRFVRNPEPPCVALTNSEESRLAKLLAGPDAPEAINGKTGSRLDDAQNPAPVPNLIAGLHQLNFIMLLGALGAAGAATQSIASMASYLGAKRFASAWTVFYLTRPWVGAVLGPVFYLVLRGGLTTPQASWKDVNHVGYAAVAILVGFCASEAMENLRQIGGAFFRRKDPRDGLDSPEPHIASAFIEGDVNDPKDRELHILGSNFSENVRVYINDILVLARPTRIDSSTLRLSIQDDLVANSYTVVVENPGDTPLKSNRVNAKRSAIDEMRDRFQSKRSPRVESATRVSDKTAPWRQLLEIKGTDFGAEPRVLLNHQITSEKLVRPDDNILLLALRPEHDYGILTVHVLATGERAVLSNAVVVGASPPVPVITGVKRIATNGASVGTLRITGRNFIPPLKAFINEQPREAKLTGHAEIDVQLQSTDNDPVKVRIICGSDVPVFAEFDESKSPNG